MTTRFPFSIAALLLAVLACTPKAAVPAPSAHAPSTSPPAASPSVDAPGAVTRVEPAPSDDMFACHEDADCTLVALGCCDPCNGGWILAVGKDHVDAAQATYDDRDCTGTACTEKGCEWQTPPVCDAGFCARAGQDGQANKQLAATKLEQRR